MATLALPPIGAAYRIPAGSTVYTPPSSYVNSTTALYATDRPGMPPPLLAQIAKLVLVDPGLSTERVVMVAANGIAYGAVYYTTTWLGIVNGTAAALNTSLYGSANDWPLLASIAALETVYGWSSFTQE